MKVRKPLTACALLVALAAMVYGPAALGGGSSEADSATLLSRAREAREAAEAALEEARQRRLAERKALAAELQAAYDRLDTARERAGRVNKALKSLRETIPAVRERRRVLEEQRRTLISRAFGALDEQADASRPLGELEGELRSVLTRGIEELAEAGEVRVQKQWVIGRDGAARELPVLRLGAFAAYACGPSRESCGLLRTDGVDTPLVAGPYLDEEQMANLRAAAGGSLNRLPVDVDGALRDRPPQERKSVRSWLKAGGMFVYPIIFVAVLGMLLVLERLGYLLSTRRSPAAIREVLERLEGGDVEGARDALSGARGPTARVMAAGLEARGKSEQERETAMESALLAEAPRMERSLSFLAALAAVAPLLGLLGTVSGMIATFNTISAAGTGNPRLLSGGISEALITTQLGLIVAIPLLLIHAWLQRWVERREAMLEYDAIQVFGLEHHEGEDRAE